MSIELRPLGVRCNIACHYCYQQPTRAAQDVVRSYDLDAMKAAIAREGGAFALFGGEPLLLPKRDLEELWRWGFDRYGHNAVQTNGTLLDADHIRMFKQYTVHVGVSIDGPGELNDARFAASAEYTRRATERTEAAIDTLCDEGIPPGVIVTLHRLNATAEKLPRLASWLRRLEQRGVSHCRLHLLESESPEIEQRYGLSHEENVDALLALARLEGTLGRLRFDLFSDMRRMLLGDDGDAACVWHACDPYTTPAVRGIEGHGQSSNCGRTNKDGIEFQKAATHGFERVLALYHTPQAFQGCKGCRFFLMCKGQCPGTSERGDWRNRSSHCAVWKALYAHFESHLRQDGFAPISSNPIRHLLERRILERWEQGRATTMAAMLEVLRVRADACARTVAGWRSMRPDALGASS